MPEATIIQRNLPVPASAATFIHTIIPSFQSFSDIPLSSQFYHARTSSTTLLKSASLAALSPLIQDSTFVPPQEVQGISPTGTFCFSEISPTKEIGVAARNRGRGLNYCEPLTVWGDSRRQEVFDCSAVCRWVTRLKRGTSGGAAKSFGLMDPCSPWKGASWMCMGCLLIE